MLSRCNLMRVSLLECQQTRVFYILGPARLWFRCCMAQKKDSVCAVCEKKALPTACLACGCLLPCWCCVQGPSLPVVLPGQQLPFMPPQQQQQTAPAGSSPPSGQAGNGAEEPQAQPQLLLSGLELVLGPELRAVFPVVLNVGVSGRLALSGNPAAPNGLAASGSIRLEGGVLNLVATQFRLEREHPNTISFSPEAGLDPMLDVALSSSELRAVINGRASAWQDHLSLTAVGPAASVGGGPGGVGVSGGAGGGGGGPAGAAGRDAGLAGLADGDLLGGRAVARVFEGRLAEALLAEDGSLSLATLAGNTLGSLMPKIETQGQLGKARYAALGRGWQGRQLMGLMIARPSRTASPSMQCVQYD